MSRLTITPQFSDIEFEHFTLVTLKNNEPKEIKEDKQDPIDYIIQHDCSFAQSEKNVFTREELEKSFAVLTDKMLLDDILLESKFHNLEDILIFFFAEKKNIPTSFSLAQITKIRHENEKIFQKTPLYLKEFLTAFKILERLLKYAFLMQLSQLEKENLEFIPIAKNTLDDAITQLQILHGRPLIACNETTLVTRLSHDTKQIIITNVTFENFSVRVGIHLTVEAGKIIRQETLIAVGGHEQSFLEKLKNASIAHSLVESSLTSHANELDEVQYDGLVYSAIQEYLAFQIQPPATFNTTDSVTATDYGSSLYSVDLFNYCPSYLALVTVQLGLLPVDRFLIEKQKKLYEELLHGKNFLDNLKAYLLHIAQFITKELNIIFSAETISRVTTTKSGTSLFEYMFALAINFVFYLQSDIKSEFLSNVLNQVLNQIFSSKDTEITSKITSVINFNSWITDRIKNLAAARHEIVVSCCDALIQNGYSSDNLSDFTGVMSDGSLRSNLLKRLFEAFKGNYRLNEQLFPFLVFFNVLDEKNPFHSEIRSDFLSKNLHISALLKTNNFKEAQHALRRLYCGFLYLQYKQGSEEIDNTFRQAISLFIFYEKRSPEIVPRRFRELESLLWHAFRFINNQRVFPLETGGRIIQENFTTPLADIFNNESSPLVGEFTCLRELYVLYKAFFLLADMLERINMSAKKKTGQSDPEAKFFSSEPERNQLFNVLVQTTLELKKIRVSENLLLRITATKLYDLIILLRSCTHRKISEFKNEYKSPSLAWPNDIQNITCAKLKIFFTNTNNMMCLDDTTDKDETALHLAAGQGLKNVVMLLLTQGAVVDATNDNLMTPLMYATRCKNTSAIIIVQQLLLAHANPTLRDRDSRTALHHAAEMGNKEIALMIARRHPDLLLLKDIKFATPIDAASQAGHHQLAKELTQFSQLSAAPKFAALPETRRLTLFQEHTQDRLIIHKGSLAIITPITLNREWMQQSKNDKGQTLFLHAVVEGDLAFVEWCLKNSPDSINDLDNKKRDLMMLAIENNRTNISEYLLTRFPITTNISSRTDMMGRTALHYAVLKDDEKKVKQLIHAGWDVEKLCAKGMSPLRYAVAQAQKNIIHHLMMLTKHPSENDLLLALLFLFAEKIQRHERNTQLMVYIDIPNQFLARLSDAPLVMRRYKSFADQIELSRLLGTYEKYQPKPEYELIKGNISIALENTPGAILYYRRAKPLPEACNRLGIAYYLQYEWEKAASQFKEAHEMEPNNQLYLSNYQQLTALTKTEEKEEASTVLYLDMLDRLTSQLSAAQCIGAFVNMIKKEKLEKMLADYEKCEASPQNEIIVGNIHFAGIDPNKLNDQHIIKAMECYQRAKNLAALNETLNEALNKILNKTLNKMGIIYFFKKQFESAIKCFKQAMEAEPTNGDYQTNYIQLIEMTEAKAETVKKGIEEKDILTMLDNLLFRLNDSSLVTLSYSGLVTTNKLNFLIEKYRALKSTPANELIKGNLYMALNNLPQAIECYQRAEKSPTLLNKLGLAYFLYYDWINAEKYFKSACAADPTNIHYQMNFQKTNSLLALRALQPEVKPTVLSRFIKKPIEFKNAFLIFCGKSPYQFTGNSAPRRNSASQLYETKTRQHHTLFEGEFVPTLKDSETIGSTTKAATGNQNNMGKR